MTVTADKPAPYAPASAILGLIERHRNKGLPTPVTGDILARAGMGNSLIPRTLQALQTLDLIDENGQPTETLEALRLAPEPEFKQRMAEWLNEAYADALSFIDPAVDDDVRIRDAFRNYKPVGQQPRMVTLFSGLFTAAGVMPERQRQSPRTKRPSGPANGNRLRPQRAAASRTRSEPSRHRAGHHGGATPSGDLPPALAGLLASLPTNGEGWTQAKRDSFLATFEAVLDYCVPIVEREEQEPEEENEMEDAD